MLTRPKSVIADVETVLRFFQVFSSDRAFPSPLYDLPRVIAQQAVGVTIARGDHVGFGPPRIAAQAIVSFQSNYGQSPHAARRAGFLGIHPFVGGVLTRTTRRAT